MNRALHTRRGDRGFTMVEMIVVLILIGIASASIFPAITTMMRSSTRSAAMTSSSGDGRMAERLIEHDVRGAASFRGNGDRGDLGTSDSSVINALNSTSVTFHDIREARPTVLRVWTEVISTSAGPEDVTWTLQDNSPQCGSPSPNWCIERVVRNQGGAVLASEIATRGRGAFPASIPGNPCGTSRVLFCYRTSEAQSYRWDHKWNSRVCNLNTTGCAGGASCVIQWRKLDLAFGGGWINNVQHNGFDAAVQLHPLDRITTIAVTMPSGGGFGATTERTFSTTELAIRSRQGDAYQRAIMCGGR